MSNIKCQIKKCQIYIKCQKWNVKNKMSNIYIVKYKMSNVKSCKTYGAATTFASVGLKQRNQYWMWIRIICVQYLKICKKSVSSENEKEENKF